VLVLIIGREQPRNPELEDVIPSPHMRA
jgi:hypothetical protein